MPIEQPSESDVVLGREMHQLAEYGRDRRCQCHLGCGHGRSPLLSGSGATRGEQEKSKYEQASHSRLEESILSHWCSFFQRQKRQLPLGAGQEALHAMMLRSLYHCVHTPFLTLISHPLNWVSRYHPLPHIEFT